MANNVTVAFNSLLDTITKTSPFKKAPKETKIIIGVVKQNENVVIHFQGVTSSRIFETGEVTLEKDFFAILNDYRNDNAKEVLEFSGNLLYGCSPVKFKNTLVLNISKFFIANFWSPRHFEKYDSEKLLFCKMKKFDRILNTEFLSHNDSSSKKERAKKKNSFSSKGVTTENWDDIKNDVKKHSKSIFDIDKE